MQKIPLIKITLIKIIDGKKHYFIGTYPKNDDLIYDFQRVYQKHGYNLRFEPDELDKNLVNIWRRKK